MSRLRSRSHRTHLLIGLALLSLGATSISAAEIVIYSFEGTLEGWTIPDWAKSSADYVGLGCQPSQSQSHEGRYALELQTDFPGGHWTGAYVERELEVTDWTPFSRLSVDMYLPPAAPQGLEGRMILSVGEQWTWTEMNQAVPLKPGEWTTLTVNLKPGSMDWKFFPNDAFRASVRKLGVRVESSGSPAYRGSVYLDNIRMAE